ncbi:MAG: AMP-binding protein, partial [Planctomycetaceae bacterium]|nr:AMP-binding protein [Planctomycetaceae bacterium]
MDDPQQNPSTAVGFNIADRLELAAKRWPHQRCVIFPESRTRLGRVAYTQVTFQQLHQETDELAVGLHELGVRAGHRLVLMVKPGIEFIALTWAIFKSGATVVLIDPGMGRKRIFDCLDEVQPHGFVAIPIVHAIRQVRRGQFRQAKLNVSVSRGRNWGGLSYQALREQGRLRLKSNSLGELLPRTQRNDMAAIIFTSGSTGPPKGVVYEHGMFNAQVDFLQAQYQIQPGEIDLPGFPLFALFNAAMGVTTVIPDMDFTRPADVNPLRILEAIHDQGVTQAFGSPALWNRVGGYCREKRIPIPSLKRVLSAGAPVPVHVLQTMREAAVETGWEMFTPYGATEALPVCNISASEVLKETRKLTAQGKGTCVGRPFTGVDVKVIEPFEGPIESLSHSRECKNGTIGEIIVRSPSATREYYGRPEATAAAKIPDGNTFWHRMGDMGYRDDQGRFWFCGRKAHIVHAAEGRMYPVCCEAILNEHPAIYRSALVGVGKPGAQRPVLIAEPYAANFPTSEAVRTQLLQELSE